MSSLIPRMADQNSSISTSVRAFSWLQIAKQIRRDKPTVGSANPGRVSLDCIGKIAECEPSSKLGSSIPSWVPLQVSFNSCLGVPRWRTGTSKQASPFLPTVTFSPGINRSSRRQAKQASLEAIALPVLWAALLEVHGIGPIKKLYRASCSEFSGKKDWFITSPELGGFILQSPYLRHESKLRTLKIMILG